MVHFWTCLGSIVVASYPKAYSKSVVRFSSVNLEELALFGSAVGFTLIECLLGVLVE